MKTKALVIASFAFVIGIGSAFASFLTCQDAYVRCKLRTNPEGATQCVNTGLQCDNTGDLACTIVMPVTAGTQTACTGCTFKPYGAGCMVVLKGSTNCSGGMSNVMTCDHLVQ